MSGSSAFPDAPSLAKAAEISGYDIGAWIGIAAAPGTPKEITQRLATEIGKAVQTKEVRERMQNLGLEPAAPMTPDEMAVFLRKEQQRYGDIIRTANIKIEEGNK